MRKILRHEVTFLEAGVDLSTHKFLAVAKTQGENAGIRADWHDNAAYDEAVRLTQMASTNLSNLQRELNTSEVIDYPKNNDTEIKLGSLVLAADAYGAMTFILVGQRLVGSNYYHHLWDSHPQSDSELLVVTPESALGKVALGTDLEQSQQLTYKLPTGQSQTVSVESIDQVWVQENLSTITKQELLLQPSRIF